MPLMRNVLGCIAGLIIGSVVNMALVTIGPSLIPPPEGVDLSNVEAMKNSAHLLEPQHFIFPFLGHALGTLAGALVAFAIAASRKTLCAFIIGFMFLAGGITAALTIPAPVWFVVLDLVVAYLPMAWLGTRLGSGLVGR